MGFFEKLTVAVAIASVSFPSIVSASPELPSKVACGGVGGYAFVTTDSKVYGNGGYLFSSETGFIGCSSLSAGICAWKSDGTAKCTNGETFTNVEWVSNSWLDNYSGLNDPTYYGGVVKKKDGTFTKTSGSQYDLSIFPSSVTFISPGYDFYSQSRDDGTVRRIYTYGTYTAWTVSGFMAGSQYGGGQGQDAFVNLDGSATYWGGSYPAGSVKYLAGMHRGFSCFLGDDETAKCVASSGYSGVIANTPTFPIRDLVVWSVGPSNGETDVRVGAVKKSDNKFYVWDASNSATGIVDSPNVENPYGTCFDGILNQDETDIDTGGVCGYDYEDNPPLPAPSVDAYCGTASRNYAYTGSSYAGNFCNAGTLSGTGSPSFPAPASYESWQCLGSGSGSDVTCHAYRSGPPYTCATPIPNFANVGTLNYSPTEYEQAWTYSSNASASCSYSCNGGYSGSGCTTAPTAPIGDGGASSEGIWSAITGPFKDIADKFSEFVSWVKGIFEIVDTEGNAGISFGDAGEKFKIAFSMTDKIVGLGGQRVSETMTINGVTCPKNSILPNSISESDNGVLTVHTRKAYQYNGRWNCYTFLVSDLEYDLKKMVVDGKFTYMKTPFGDEVTASNVFKIDTSFRNSISVNVGFDLKIFGFSVISEPLSKSLGFLLDTLVYVADFLTSLGSNTLDLFSMGTIRYGAENYGPFYFEGYPDSNIGHIVAMGSVWPYFKEPYTPDGNWIFDEIMIALTIAYVTRKYWKKRLG